MVLPRAGFSADWVGVPSPFWGNFSAEFPNLTSRLTGYVAADEMGPCHDQCREAIHR
jgi:hypothetical protein